VERNGDREANTLRVPGTLVAEQNFGIVEVAGPRGQRRLTMSVHDAAGTARWTRTIEAAELR
jgi:hypothetical protein